MFTRLRELEKKYIYQKKQQPSYLQKSATRNKLKQVSYSRLHNKSKRAISIQSQDYQIVSNESYIYQGQWRNNQKNGEGIVFLKNGTMIIGHWLRDKLNGRSLILTPYGSLINAEFIDNKLNGWVLAQYSNKVIIANLYFEDHIDGPRIVFQGSQQFWIASNFTPDGQFVEIINVQKGQKNKLPLFFENDTLSQLFDNMVIHKNYAYDFQKIKSLELVSKTHYIGYLDHDHLPSGLGATYSDSECFIGNFSNGYLQDFGRMIFANGDIYHGGIITGAFLGNGIYYNPRKNQTLVIDTSIEGETQVIQQQSGYYHLDFNITLGEKMNKQDTVFISHATQKFLKSLEKYYHQYYIQTRIKQEEAFSNISQRQSENMGINDIDEQENNRAEIKLKKKKSLTKWIANDQEEEGYSEEGSKIQAGYSMQPETAKPYFSPKNKTIQDYFSLKVNQNQEPLEKQKHNMQNPRQSSYKKMFIAIPDKNPLLASKSLDIRELTFRGNNKQIPSSGRSGIFENGRQFQYDDIVQMPYHKGIQNQQLYSQKNSSNISQMDEKLLGVMKKSNFRRKIFQ